MKIQRNIGNKGFTLVELMIVIVIIGVLAALASFGFMQYVKKSKTGEADELTRKMADGAKTYFTTEQKYGGDESAWHSSGTPGFPVPYNEKVFPGGKDKSISTHTATPEGGTKLAPVLTTDSITWKKLQFDVTDPTYFRYFYNTSNGTGNSAVAAIFAVANFDGGAPMGDPSGTDAVTTASGDADHTVQRRVTVNANGEVVLNPPLMVNEFK